MRARLTIRDMAGQRVHTQTVPLPPAAGPHIQLSFRLDDRDLLPQDHIIRGGVRIDITYEHEEE